MNRESWDRGLRQVIGEYDDIQHGNSNRYVRNWGGIYLGKRGGLYQLGR